MSDGIQALEWDRQAQEKFKLMIGKMPLFHRRMAESAVIKKSQDNARLRNASLIEELDIVSAFFSEVPKPFYGMMIKLLEEAKFDYKKYGFPKH